MILAAALGLIAAARVGLAADVYVVTAAIRGLDPDRGVLRIELHDAAETYLSRDDAVVPYRRRVIRVHGDVMEVRFAAVPPGRYALSMYQDVNGNGELDSNFFAIPNEPYGFSNNPKIVFGPPTFEEASFELVGAIRIDIELR